MLKSKILSAALAALTFMLTAANVSAAPAAPSYDINSDGETNISDAVLLYRYINKLGTLTKEEWEAADFNSDKKVNIIDYSLLKKQLIRQGYVFTARELGADLLSDEVTGKAADADFVASQDKFALELFKNEYKETENVMISPYSVMQALAMTANGADGSTKTEMEAVLGDGMDMDTLNGYLYEERKNLDSTENVRFSTANSIWTRQGYSFRQDFLQNNKNWFDAAVYDTPMDNTTVDDVNFWINDKTLEMIPHMLDYRDVNELTRMLLINAVAFDAEWQKKYEPEDVHKNIFNSIDGTKDSVDFMFSTEGTTISDDTATGFIKYYQGGEYAFAAILPDEKLSLKEYVNSLTPEKFSKLLESKTNEELIRAGMPKFSYDYSSELNDSLISMGMPSAFDGDLADFGRMFDRNDPNFDNLYIDYVLHKTHIGVDEEGTRAAAATVVAMKDCAVLVPEKQIILDRPFMYAIIDTKTNIPVFIGSVTNFE